MIISFFEEFATKQNLEKIRLIRFKTKIYLASKDVNTFSKVRDKILESNKKVIDVAWWPILEKDEEYWMSPWSKREALRRIIEQANKDSFDILWDAELPIDKKIFTLPLTPRFYKNRKLIRNFIKNSKNKIYTAEYKSKNRFLDFWLEFCGISFKPWYKHFVIKMVYSNLFGTIDKDELYNVIKHNKKRYKGNFILSLGVLAKGLGNEKIISPKELKKCLDIARTNGIKEVVLFRLGGLSKDYLNVIYDFCDM